MSAVITYQPPQVAYNDLERMAAAVATSRLFGMETREQAIALMLIAQAEGLHPAIAARDYHVIQGRPALKADAMLARFQAQGGKVSWGEYTDTKVEATFSHPQGGTVTVDWTIARAQTAGLAGKGTWKQYPRQMLRARVISEGIRTVFPGVAVGVYTPEEVQDFEPEPPARRPAAVCPIRPEAIEVKAEPVKGPPKPEKKPLPAISESELADILIAIRECEDMENLVEMFGVAATRARRNSQTDVMTQLTAAKDTRKAQLQPQETAQ